MTIRVLVVDDSRLVREILVEIINGHSDMQVVGVAEDPYVARYLIRDLAPDVLTLDVEMPRMSGLEFLERLMRAQPMPVVMISAYTAEGSEVTLRALELGAVEFVPKPRLNTLIGEDYAGAVAEAIRAAHAARVRALPQPQAPPASPNRMDRPPGRPRPVGDRCESVIVIGASTGGTEALRVLLTPLPVDAPALVVAQHMPEHFTRLFAARLDSLCQLRVREAEDNAPVRPGHAYIAPGGQHLRIVRVGDARYVLKVSCEAPVNMHRPSIEVLFDSAAVALGSRAIGVILTGMGKDGAAGLLRMRRAGAYTFAQDEASSVVFGMPREAAALGGVDEVVSIHALPERILATAAARSRRLRPEAESSC